MGLIAQVAQDQKLGPMHMKNCPVLHGVPSSMVIGLARKHPLGRVTQLGALRDKAHNVKKNC